VDFTGIHFRANSVYNIFVNDIVDNCTNGSEIFLYADNAKLFRYVRNEEDSKKLQDDLIYIRL
jgi:hypothetical protein